MIKRRQRQVRAPNRERVLAQYRERLWCRYFVDDVQVDIKDGRRFYRLFDYDMIRPDLFEQGSGCAQDSVSVSRWLRE